MNFELKTADRLAKLLDNEFGFFGYSFGLDAIFGLIPWFGDTLALILSLYIVYVGWKLDMPQTKKYRMLANVGIDYAIDFIPVIGDLSWIVYKPNVRNMAIIKEHLPARVIEGKVVAQNSFS